MILNKNLFTCYKSQRRSEISTFKKLVKKHVIFAYSSAPKRCHQKWYVDDAAFATFGDDASGAV